VEFFNILFWIKPDFFPPIPALQEVKGVPIRVMEKLKENNTKVYN